MKDRDVFRTVTATLEFLLVLMSFLSNCFSDQSVFEITNLFPLSHEWAESSPLINSSVNDVSLVQASNVSPESKASFLSRLNFTWLTGLMIKGYRNTLTFDDLYTLEEENTCRKIIPKILKEWNQELERAEEYNKRKAACSDKSKIEYQNLKNETFSNNDNYLEDKILVTPSFIKALCHTVGYPSILAGFLRLVYDLSGFLFPFLLGLVIKFIENPNDYIWHGYFFAISIFGIAITRTTCSQNHYYLCYRTGMRVKTALIGTIYRKALKLSPTQKEATIGEIVNLMSVDSQKIYDSFMYLHNIWCTPIVILLAITILWQYLGPSVLAGFAFLACLIPVNVIISMKLQNLQIKQLKVKDCRLKLINEVISGMTILKLYGWENIFGTKILKIRNDECHILQRVVYIYALMSASWFCAPFLISLCTFTAYLLSNETNSLSVTEAFISITVFNILNIQLQLVPETIINAIQARVSLQRVNTFLITDELDPHTIEICSPEEHPVKIINGTLSWDKNKVPFLNEINIEIQEGSLIVIVGAVGSGKTSLISALIGDMFKVSGQVKCRGSIAYVPQQPWCLNASVKDNILFNKLMNNEKYNKVIEACALLEDLKVFPSGDETEIGERGINLSGGQKLRISLARAIYQDLSIYILDDPLSAVDSNVGKHIFDKVIGPNGLLSTKTRILITHGLKYLPKVDKIFVMRDQKICESGSFVELLNNNGSFAELIRSYFEIDDENLENSDDEDKKFIKTKKQKITLSSPSPRSDSQSSTRSLICKTKFKNQEKRENEFIQNKLIEEEIVEISTIKCSVYLSYIRAATYFVAFVALISYISYMFFSIATYVFLSKWTETQNSSGIQRNKSLGLFFSVYGGLGAGQVIFIIIQNLSLAYGTILASKSLHYQLLTNILRAPSLFFNITPLGRILNRIGTDIDTVDFNFFPTIRHYLIALTGLLASLIVIIISFPFSIFALIPLIIIYIMLQKLYIKSSRQIKRIEAIKRSPIYSHFQESLVGASSIRAYKVENIFIDKCDTLTDENQKSLYLNIVGMRWFQLFSESIGNIIVLLAIILSVVTKSTIGAGLAALSISLSMQVPWTFNYMVRMINDLEANIVSVERIQEYINIEQEAPWNIDETKPDSDWPAREEIKFVHYSVRYRPELDLVLKDLSFVIHAGEKFGIVGRTGAGKSSLGLGLFRLMEPAEGSILIDNVDISTFGLHNLRTKLAIIPQDPILFCGTLRMNLDPLNEYSDEQLWDVLEMVHLKSFVVTHSDRLNLTIADHGENLSFGQKQLVSLARVLLKRAKILILDEATSGIDLETDGLIQKSIRDQFHNCTVVTIAHRINTIMDYDRVMVLGEGRISELDTPQNLLRNTKSEFYNMAKEAGLA